MARYYLGREGGRARKIDIVFGCRFNKREWWERHRRGRTAEDERVLDQSGGRIFLLERHTTPGWRRSIGGGRGLWWCRLWMLAGSGRYENACRTFLSAVGDSDTHSSISWVILLGVCRHKMRSVLQKFIPRYRIRNGQTNWPTCSVAFIMLP